MEIYDQNVENLLQLPAVIHSLREATDLHKKFIELRCKIYSSEGVDVMPHYRSEQKFGWDITPGVFRKNHYNAAEGKELERKAALRFHHIVTERYGAEALRNIFNREKFGEDWDLLF